MSKRTPEGQVLHDVVTYLDKIGVFWIRLDTKGQYRETNNGWQYVASQYTKQGTPDLLCFPQGQPVWMEIKRPNGGRLSTDQLLMKKRIEAHCMEWCCVRSVDDVRKLGFKP